MNNKFIFKKIVFFITHFQCFYWHSAQPIWGHWLCVLFCADQDSVSAERVAMDRLSWQRDEISWLSVQSVDDLPYSGCSSCQ